MLGEINPEKPTGNKRRINSMYYLLIIGKTSFLRIQPILLPKGKTVSPQNKNSDSQADHIPHLGK
jgi:hypothetical protein